MHERPVRLVPAKHVPFIFVGPSELIRSRTSFSQVVSHASTLSVVKHASYKR